MVLAKVVILFDRIAALIADPGQWDAADSLNIASGALALYKALNVSNKKLVHFSEEEGSGGHCEMLARSLYNQRVFDKSIRADL
jgi:hypothetical protein